MKYSCKTAIVGAATLVFASLTPTLAAHAADAKPAAPASPAKYSTTDTSIGALMDDPASKAVLVKHVPAMAENPQMEMARSMTLRQVQGYASDMLTDDVLAAIDKDLAALPAK